MRQVLVVEHAADGGLGHFDPWLREAGVEPVVARPYTGAPLPALDGYDGLIVLGGEMGAWDDDAAPWLPGVRARLSEGVREGRAVLGICLGAQLLTAACGGRVAPAAEVPGADAEIGVVDITVDAAGDRLLDPLTGTIPVTQWHYDMIAEPPPGAVALAHSPACPYEAYRLGDRAWGVQFHPEVRRADFDTWNTAGLDTLTSRGLTPEALLAAYDARAAEIRAAARRVAHAFAAEITARDRGEVPDSRVP
ncbi:MAG TPA: type 1 glutamine amidotransferase [Streptosporangiaceae bacterium]|jgi:GMP synthase-like glutamine amidotransferase